MRLFSRKSEAPAAPAPAKQTRKALTCAELDTALTAVFAEMGDCSTRRTLQAFNDLTSVSDYYGAEGVFKLNGSAPVSLTQFDEALADLDNYDLPANTLGPLKRLRALLANAETREAKAAGAPVTRAEFEAAQAANALAFTIIEQLFREPNARASLSTRLEIAAQSVEFESASTGIRTLLEKIEKASHADGARQMRRASGRLNVVNGGNGRNY